MDTIQNTVHYCCVSKGNRILYTYSDGDHEIENLASLALERTPTFHRWYFVTTRKRTFAFLMEDGYVYFTIVDEGLGNSGILRFLEHVRDEFKKVARKGSRGSFSSMSSIGLQEQLVPVICRLITTLENISHGSSDWTGETPSPPREGLSLSPSNANGPIEAASSTKAPLLGKSSKQEKKAKDHLTAMRDIELEEHRRSTDRGMKTDLESLDFHNQGSSQKDLGSMRSRSGSQSFRKKYLRQIRIVLAIDAAVCLVLLVIWLLICHGISCLR